MQAKGSSLFEFTSPDWRSAGHRRRLKWRYLIATSHHLTFYLGRRFPDIFPLVFVLGFPKSGTSWVCQIFADYLRLPFPQNSLFPIGFPAVVHGHETCRADFPRTIYVVRDGRDAMVSLYFHLSARGEPTPGQPANDGAGDFEEFVLQQLRRPTGSRVAWGDHVRSHLDSTAQNQHVLVRYETLLANPTETFSTALRTLTGHSPDERRVTNTIEKFAFPRSRNGDDSLENRSSYFRKGKAGDWRNHFTPKAARAFAESCGDMLIAAGYEHDNSWVTATDRRAA